MKPTVGRIVHYVSYGTPGGEYGKEHRAAIITAVQTRTTIRELSTGQLFEMKEGKAYLDTEWSEPKTEEVVSLCVLNPTGQFFNQNVPFDATGEFGGTWHWPERE